MNTYKFLIIISSFLLLASCIKDEPLKLKEQSYTPQNINDDWVLSTPFNEGVPEYSIQQIYEKFFSEEEYHTAISLLIAKNGKLISEAYCRTPHDRDIFHQTQSVSKSVTSLVFGIAVDQGYFPDLDSAICNYFPEHIISAEKRAITIRHLLTMKAGLDFNNSSDSEQLINYSENSLKFILNKALLYNPGTKYNYNDGCPQIISALIQKKTGLSMQEFADKFFFKPLNIVNYKWDKHQDGITYGANNLWLTSRDMLKIGQLILNDGSWKGIQVISESWLSESFKIQSTPTGHGPYGFYWYIRPDNKAIVASGVGGQYIYIIPEKDIVVVFTAEPYASPLISSYNWDLEGEIIGLLD